MDDVRLGAAMSMVAPKGRKHLCADALFRLLHEHFATIVDDDVDEGEIPLDPSLTVARYMILRLFISTFYRWYPMYLGCLFCLFVYVEFFRICL